ncbi:MAG TPA: AEC family transporter [Caproiciproducens sp.]|nr:AEC family transporter [Caproiciproducens sp.]
MLSSAAAVSQRVLILFIMMTAGYVCGKIGAITNRGTRQMNFILFYVVTPALLIASLQNMIGKIALTNLLIAGGISILCMMTGILISMLCFRKSPPDKRKVLRFACAYSNCGFMGLPLVQSVLGDAGVAYASMFMLLYNFFVWTHGYSLMSGSRKLNWTKILTNPGLAGMVIGFPLFAFSVHLPELVMNPLNSFASMNTPLAMIVIGCYISRVNLKEIFIDAKLYQMAAIRLLIVPAVCFGVMVPFGADKAIVTTALLLSAAPSGANTAMFAAQFGGDAKLASKAVTFTTLASILTLPVIILLTKLL